MAISAKLTAMFDKQRTLPTSTVVSTVELTPSTLLEDMAKQVKLELERIAPYAGYSDVSELEVSDIHKYLKTLLWIRVCSVNQSEDKLFRDYKKVRPYVAVPVLMYQLLIAVGEAYDQDYAIKFIPAYSPTENDLLGVPELLALSDVMLRLESRGMKIVKGTPKDPSGELAFMALNHVEDTVLGYQKSHPVYGFLAAFFKQRQLNEITGTMCRIVYGYDTDYSVQLSIIFNSLNSGGGGDNGK